MTREIVSCLAHSAPDPDCAGCRAIIDEALADIKPEFRVHILNPQGIRKAAELALAFTDCLERIEQLSGESGREMAIVRTKLEEASFFAKKAMASRTENQR